MSMKFFENGKLNAYLLGSVQSEKIRSIVPVPMQAGNEPEK